MIESVRLGNTEAPLEAEGMTGMRDMEKKSVVGIWGVGWLLNYA